MFKRMSVAVAAVIVASSIPLTAWAQPACSPIACANDLRISDMGGLGTGSDRVADDPAIAYNSQDQEFLAVWTGTENASAGEQTRIYGQRLNAVTGAAVGANDFVVGTTPGGVDPARDAFSPAVAYNSTGNEYLVVWVGQPNPAGTEPEVYGQRVAASGALIGVAVQISLCGALGDFSADVGATLGYPVDICYNATANQYLVVWRCDDVGDMGIVNGKFEIIGQIVSAVGVPVLADDVQISHTAGSTGFDAESPRCAWNSVSNEYLVTWGADTPTLGGGDREIFGQRLTAAGVETGTDDFQISSSVHADEDSAISDVAHCASPNQYLVVWSGDTATDGVTNIFGQRLTAAGGLSGGRIDISGNGTGVSPANEPRVVYNSVDEEFLVTWQASVGAGEDEIFGQRVSTAGALLGKPDFRISDLGPDANTNYDAQPSHGLAYANSGLNSYCVVFNGGDDRDGQLVGENEIFVQLIDPVLEVDLSLLSSDAGVDAADTVSYQIVVRHKEVTEGGDTQSVSLRDAFNVDVSADLPDLLTGGVIVSAEIDDGNTQTDVSGDFGIDGSGDLTTTGTVDLFRCTNGDLSEELTIVVAGTIPDTAQPGDVIAENIAHVTWENDSDGLARAGYCGESPVTDAFDVGAFFSVTKTVVGAASVPTGSTVKFQLETKVIEGTTTNLQFVDTLPGTGSGTDGLSYVDNSAKISNANGMTPNAFSASFAAQTLTIDIASVVNPGNVDNAAVIDRDSFFITYEVTVDSCTGGQDLMNDVLASADSVAGGMDSALVSVQKADTTTTVSSSPDPSEVNQPYTVTVTVESVPPGCPDPTGSVVVDDGLGGMCVANLSGGSGSCTLTPTTAGSRTLTATYAGDANYNGSSGTDTHQVNDPGPGGICGDLDGDDDVDLDDFMAFFAALFKCAGDAGYRADADLDSDGCVTYADYQLWIQCYLQFLNP